MSGYSGPERRSVITFTREDSDRLVRVEQRLIAADEKLVTFVEKLAKQDETIDEQADRINSLERKQSWMMGIGAAVTFIISTVVYFLKSLHS